MNKAIVILVAGAMIAGAILLAGGKSSEEEVPAKNVSIVDGVQIVEIYAKGGYRPRKSFAQSGIPTIVRMKTSGTFDCSIALRIPDKNISTYLPQSGNTDFDIGTPEPGTLNGLCSMGMYRFAIEFK